MPLTVKMLQAQLTLMLENNIVNEDDEILVSFPGKDTFLVGGTCAPRVAYNPCLQYESQALLLFGKAKIPQKSS